MEPDKKPRALRAAAVRRADIEPYTALRWVGILFKAGAVFLGVAILAEIVAGVGVEGWDALPVLMGELARTLVLAIVLWGAGDLVRLLIHLGHDIRAERILLARIAHRLPARQRTGASPGATGPLAPTDHELALPHDDAGAAARARDLTERASEEQGGVQRAGDYGGVGERRRRGRRDEGSPDDRWSGRRDATDAGGAPDESETGTGSGRNREAAD